ncbi:hypothetical protein ACFP9V_08960 [Deinococcus radiopugnans]|uniref:Uncharacterized protein n=1 Tax=Deinococcus radiopugnans ATCC 19172 TaxID=585398 RepID=A0ABR6NQW0_9DEIO|nr:hypothetical protein [Deinococcus radiopugnans]MBB6016422.1 hypothetical protein [Deinococcus radiopugnans ATCC 19172]
MLDNILNSVKRGAERVQRRGEEVAQVARLRLEVFQLGREVDSHFARLGRAYHAGAEPDTLSGIQDEIRRAEEEIGARERLISELGEEPQAEGEMTVYSPDGVGRVGVEPVTTNSVKPSVHPSSTTSDVPVAGTEPNIPASVPHPQQPTFQQEVSIMTNPRPDKERLEQQRGEIDLNQTDRSHHDASQGDYTAPDPTVQHADELLKPGDDTAGVALEAERDKVFRHKNTLEEGKRASAEPDPLDL